MRAESWIRGLATGTCALALVFAGGRAEARRPSSDALATGLRGITFAKPPPDFAFHTDARVAHLREFVGHPVVLNFWATWCEPCEAELETFARLRETYGAGVPLVVISAEAPGVATAHLAARHIDAISVEDDGHRIADLYSVSAIPVTLVLGRDGAVAHVSVGQIDWPELRDALDPLVSPARPPADLTPQAKSSTVRGNAGTPTR